MKIQAEIVVEFLDKVKALVEDINYTIRHGDDGFEEAVRDQVETVSKVIEIFKLEQLTPVTPIEPSEKRYGRIYDNLSDREDITASESIQLYKSELYFAVTRLIKASTTISECPNNDLCNYIESLIPSNSKYNKLIYSDQFFRTSINVIQEVADEIIEQRRKAPQKTLF